MVWDSESEEAGASSDCIIYLGNGILNIFRQPLIYLWFSYSYLDGLRKYVDSILSSNNNIYLLQLGCHLVAVVILHVNKT